MVVGMAASCADSPAEEVLPPAWLQLVVADAHVTLGVPGAAFDSATSSYTLSGSGDVKETITASVDAGYTLDYSGDGACTIDAGVAPTFTLTSDGTCKVTFSSTPTIVAKRRVFLTSGKHTGDLGGIAGADMVCMTDPSYPGAGTFKALLVDGSARVACTSASCTAAMGVDWVLAPNTTYYRADDSTQIGTTTAAATFAFAIKNPISNSAATAFTGLDADWTTASAATCSGFATANPDDHAAIGDSGADNDLAIADTTVACNQATSVYCVEQ